MQTPIELREGVELIRAREIQGSRWCIRDPAQNKEWNISANLALFLTGKNNHSEKATDYRQALEQIKVLKGSEIPAPATGISLQQTISQKVTLLRPDGWLQRHPKLVALPFQPTTYALLAILGLIAAWTVFGQWHAFYQYHDTYQDATLAILFALAITKALHEFGHAFAIGHAKGKVTGMGIALIAGMPLPKTDAALLAHANRNSLIKIALAGVYFELWAAVIATILWGGMADGAARSAMHSVAVVSLAITVAANALPLMKFDGYHLLSAVLDEPRLYEDSIAIFRKSVFAMLGKESPDRIQHTGTARVWRGLYGAAIFARIVLLPIGIMLALRWYFPESNIGYIAGALPIYPMWIKPAITELQKLKHAGQCRNSTMNKMIALTLAITILSWLTIPIPHTQFAPGAIIRDKNEIKTQAEGTVIQTREKGPVLKGEVLALIAPSDQALLELSELDAQRLVLTAQLSAGTLNQNIAVLVAQKAAVTAEQNKIKQQLQQGRILAPDSGYYRPTKKPGTVQKGATLGSLYPETGTGHLNVYMKAKSGSLKETDARLLLPDGHTQKIQLYMALDHVIGTTIPDWVTDVKGGELVLYKSQQIFNDLPEMQVKVIYRRRYSIALEWLHRYLTRLAY